MKAEVRRPANLNIATGALFVGILISASLPAQTALPPRYQNVIDLEAMTEFIKQYPQVASSLASVNVRTATVHFANDCKVIFRRKGPIVIGPAGPLAFQSSNCPIGPRSMP